MKWNKLIAYAQDFASFVLENLKEVDEIEEIILFGSIARDEFEKDSDVDIFINTKNEKIEEESNKLINKFHQSVKFRNYWELQGVNNEISIKVGELDKWDLKRSIISNGIVLYGKYKDQTKTKPHSLFIIKSDKKRNENVKLWRKLYGYKQKVKRKEYNSKGIVERYSGKKLSLGSFVVPIQHSQHVQKFLKENKVKYLIIDFWTDSIF